MIERFGIQSVMSLGIVNIDDVAYKELNNVSVYVIIRDKLVENNDMLSNILNKIFQFVVVI
jgi:hypothetical protein